MIIAAKGLIAIWTFARSRGQTLINTFFAEDVSTSLDHRVLEVALADGADCKSLIHLVSSQCNAMGKITHPKRFIYIR
jgi:hypothetical protein